MAKRGREDALPDSQAAEEGRTDSDSEWFAGLW